MANSVAVSNDGYILIGATTGTFGDGNTNFYIIKTDSDGNEIWNSSTGATGKHGHGFDWCKAMITTKDGGSISTGYSDCNDLMDVVVVKTDPSGKEEWVKSFGNNPFYEYGNSICETPDGGYLIAGITKTKKENSKQIYNNDIYIVKLDSNGTLEWQERIGNEGSEWANSMCITEYGNVAILGHSKSSNQSTQDVCLIKIKI